MYYPKVLTLLAKTNTDDVTYVPSKVTGCDYVRLDAMPASVRALHFIFSIAWFLGCLSALLEGRWFLAILLAIAATLCAYTEWLVQKQWGVIHDALSEE